MAACLLAVSAVAAPAQPTDEDVNTLEYIKHKRLGDRHATARAYGKALEAYEAALAIRPQEQDLLYNLTVVAEALKNWPKAHLYAQGYLYAARYDKEAEEYKEIAAKAAGALKNAGRSGSLSVTVEPEGAQVLVEGVSFGPAPVKVTLAAGSWEVVARKPDFRQAVRKVSLAAGAEEAVTLTLDEMVYHGAIRVETVPPDGVEVYLDGQSVGVTPLAEPIKTRANREHLLRFERQGFDPFVRAVEVPRDETVEVKVQLEVVGAGEKKKDSNEW
jgi:hypothetical protein